MAFSRGPEGAHGAPDVDVLVVGAGVTGIHQLHRAREEGFSTLLVEAGEGVGGTWFWNRYPGARFDSESYTYGYLFSRELFEEWTWSEHFAAQPETEAYLNHVVDRFGLRPHVRLGTRVTGARWDEGTATWVVDLEPGEPVRARFLVAATGVLSVPYVPDVPGRERFRGLQLHTGRWPTSPVDLAGRHVAVVGTGSSGVQLVPAIVDEVATLTVYQRSPGWCTPLNNAPITPDEQARLRTDFERIRERLAASVHGFLHEPPGRSAADDTPEERRAFFEKLWESPGFAKLTSSYPELLFDEAVNREWCDLIAEKVRAIVADLATAERLIPTDHRFGEKRPPFVTGYYEAFNDPKVRLVDLRETPIERLTERGIETTAGEQAHDVVVWATGFDFGTGALLRMGIRGRDGRALADHWADGPTTFLGVQTAGFPNLFFPGGPHAAAGNNPRYNGDQVDFVTDALVHVREAGATTIEVDPVAEARWCEAIERSVPMQSFTEKSYYFGTNVPGKPRRFLLNAAGRPKLHKEIARVKATGWAAFRIT